MTVSLNVPKEWITVRYLPATAPVLLEEPLVLLHGWGTDSRLFEPLTTCLHNVANLILVDLPGFGLSHVVDSSDDDSKWGEWGQTLLNELRQRLPERFVLLGWSLGGMVACRYALSYPDQVIGLITLASNLCFVANADWPSAMSEVVFQQFYQHFASAPLATLKRFDSLQAKGDSQEKAVLNVLRQYRRDSPNSQCDWLGALVWLSRFDNRAAFIALSQPGLHLFGQNDELVPARTAEIIATLNPTQSIRVMVAAGHAMHLSKSQEVAGEITTFLEQLVPPSRRDKYHLDKRKVAASFSRAATTYDGAAELQRHVGDQLLRQLQANANVSFSPNELLLDLGCGTGHFTDILAQSIDRVAVVGLDIAEGMLTFARQRHKLARAWLCGDAEFLPLADNSVGGIFSSLVIQWCEPLTPLFRELRRVLKPGGWLAVATLGPDTLYELRRAWHEVDNDAHVNRFTSQAAVIEALKYANFTEINLQRETRIMHYHNVNELTRELKALGAHNLNAGKSAGLTGRKRMQQFVAAYEQFRHEQKLPASYEIYYVVAR